MNPRYRLAGKWTLLLVGLIGLLACEEEIALDLQLNEPTVVIEGWITDEPGPYQFKVSQTSDYLGTSPEDLLSGAELVVRDDLGNADTLVEVRPGYYETNGLQGEQFRSYTVEATVSGATYSASNFLPRIGPIVGSGSLYCDTCVFGEGYYVGFLAQEPAGIGDYYLFRLTVNDSLYDSPFDFFVTDDRLVDGQLSPYQYPYPLEAGDTVVVEVRGISQLSYDHYITVFQQLSSGGGPFGAPPDNLLSNFDNGALGFFGTASVVKDTVIIVP
ncbi:MAG: DUF4249 family protein [Bacteroidota bacterium]